MGVVAPLLTYALGLEAVRLKDGWVRCQTLHRTHRKEQKFLSGDLRNGS